MLKNYIKIAFRNLRKNPGYSFINIGGLTIGIACCLIIFQYVAFEYSFDDFNEKAQNLYRIIWTRVQGGGEGFSNISNPTPEGELNPVIANETAIQALGFASPKEALGQKLSHGRIVGVFKDFNWSSAHEARENIFFHLGRNNPHISIKVSTKKLSKTIAAIEEIYK